MKIVCDACSAKYSIADEKVRGKVFKIRCKRCSNIIVVKGDNQEAAEQPQNFDQKETRVFDYSGYDNPSDAAAAAEAAADEGAVWHVVIDQKQVGPMTVAEIAERYQSGEVDDDTYAWREGFADWERLAAIDDFAEVVSGGGADAGGADVAAADGGLFGAAAGAENTAESDPADLFSAAAGGAGDPAADLFSGGGANAGADSLFGAAAEPEPVVDDAKLRGERSENSVLFSLSNLASLAGDSPKPAASSSPSSSSSVAFGGGGGGGGGSQTTATTEGSGLIDIRSMAQVYLGDRGPSSAAPAVGTGSIDDLPSFSPGAFDANSAVLLPQAVQDGPDKKLLYALVGVIGLLAVAAIALVVIVISGDDKPEVAAAGDQTDEVGEKDTDSETPDQEAEDDKDETGSADDKDPGTATDTATDTATETATDSKPTSGSSRPDPKPTRPSSSSSSSSSTKPSSSSTKPKPTPRADPKPDPAPSSGKCDEVMCLVEPNKACCKKRSGGSSSSSSSGGSSLPEKLGKSDVKSAIGGVSGRVKGCGRKHDYSGIVKVKVKVAGSGSVTSAVPSPGNDIGRCVASAVKGAKFKKTQKGASFSYPFRF